MTLSKSELIGESVYLKGENQRLQARCHVKDAEIERLEKLAKEQGQEIAITRERDERLIRALEGIAEYCSTDHGTLGAISRLATIRNTADQAVRADQQTEAKT